MAPPKGPPKSTSGPVFGLIVVSISLLLLLLWGWQSGWLMKAGDFVYGLVTPARYQGQGEPPAGRDAAGQPPAVPGDAAAPSQASKPPEAPAPVDVPPQTVTDASQLAPQDTPPELMPAEPPPADEPLDMEEPADERARPAAPKLPDEAAVTQELGRHWPLAELRRFFNLQEQARRLVITVDQLPRHHVPSQMRVMRGIPDPLRVKREGETLTLDPANYRRYEAFVRFAESLSPGTLVTVYRKFYPLLQHTYEEIGYPGDSFHDRVLIAIDDLLDAEQPSAPIELVQPKVLYRFADAELEALSAGRKIMIRVGPENARRLKKVLRAVRAELVRRPPGG